MAKLNQGEACFRMLKALTADIDRDLPITIAVVFARIAASPEGVDQRDVMDELKMGSSGMSRTVQTLADVHYMKGKPGLGLIERTMDLTDNRKRLLKLSSKGERLLSKLAAAAA